MAYIPAMLSEYVPVSEPHIPQPPTFATVGGNRVVGGYENVQSHHKFEPVVTRTAKGFLVIHDKRWYFRLVPKRRPGTKRARALMEDYPLNSLVNHMVVCFTPDTIPGRDGLFRAQDGDFMRIYAYFDSYLEFFEYMMKFEPSDRAFYEIIFGELPQKPHFDVDIAYAEFLKLYPGEDFDSTAAFIKDTVIAGCMQVLAERSITIDMSRDVLLYSSHGPQKQSFHIVLNNHCHDGNEEARAFYDEVVKKISILTNGKYLKFIDSGVYSPRQQFRLVGCQKVLSGRPKIFYERFTYNQTEYTHTYSDDVTEITMKKLTIMYESLVSFVSGCKFLPSWVPPKQGSDQELQDTPDLDDGVVKNCLVMMKHKIKDSPFSVREVQGNMILLQRNAPSWCPICTNSPEPHEKEHPYILIVEGKVYWDCRRRSPDSKRLFLGYLAYKEGETHSTPLGLPLGIPLEVDDGPEDDEGGKFMFGSFDLGPPPSSSPPSSSPTPSPHSSPLSSPPSSPPPSLKLNVVSVKGKVPPPETLVQNVPELLANLAKSRAQVKYVRTTPEDVTGIRSFKSVSNEMPWKI